MPPTYDKIARFYDTAFAPFEKRFLRSWRAETLSLMPADASILEIGAGTGANFAFYPRCREAVASELSAAMLRFAGEKSASVSLVQADAQFLPFPEGHFDAAFATLVFCSIPDPSAAFAEVMRVVKPGGKVVLLEHVRPPGLLGPLFDLANIFTTALIDDHFNRRTAAAAEAAGLRVLDIRTKVFGIVNLIVCENPASANIN